MVSAGARASRRAPTGSNNYGDCTWIGGMAFHYALCDDQLLEESTAFANVPAEDMPELAAKKEAKKEKKARQKANKKAKEQEEVARLKSEEQAAAAEAESTRRAGLVQVHESLAQALAKGTLR